ncbi:plasma alpha-l-fucosidase [Plakobranchus ocellatus]|uniref:alpha-L-fucosidase n=1 Tax=Plakobranchus ocellatus TaxID=259542 RepID=A0AAV3Z0X2_9GAST|nr:plasma alpha-l-fucosidase [Plakobranchus ocellatus]
MCQIATSKSAPPYQPTWASLDSRPIPSWYDEAKLGIFIHWGVFSVPSFSSEWFWYDWKGNPTPAIVEFMKQNYKPDFTYADFANQFSAEFFQQASQWADIFNSSGAKYIVFVSKHHEGYTNWPSKYSFSWNSVDVGPNIDIVGQLMNATRQRTNLKFGLYHSMFEWFHPLYLADKQSGFKTQNFVNQKTLPELYEIVNTYKPEVVWSDGDWEANDTYWKSKEYLAWLYNDSPVKDTVVVNDRWGKGVQCKHGGVYTCGDRFNPGVLQKHKWVNAMTIDKYSWGFRRNAKLEDYLTIEELLQTFVTTVSCGGNMLMNVGPPSHGHITPIYEERLRQMGTWLKVNGEGIYASKPWTYQNDTITAGVWYTMKKSKSGGTADVYAFVFDWPGSGTLSLGLPKVSPATVVTLLGFPGNLNYHTQSAQGLDIEIPAIPVNKMPCQWMWCFKITAVKN